MAIEFRPMSREVTMDNSIRDGIIRDLLSQIIIGIKEQNIQFKHITDETVDSSEMENNDDIY